MKAFLIGRGRYFSEGCGFALSDHYGVMGVVDVDAMYCSGHGASSVERQDRRAMVARERDALSMHELVYIREREQIARQCYLQEVAMKDMKFSRSTVDPCTFYQWTDYGLLTWLVYVDDCLCIGPKPMVDEAVSEMKKRFDCDDVGPMREYVGCKVEHDIERRTMKFTQPVMIQSFNGEFNISDLLQRPRSTPAEPGSVLVPALPDDYVNQKMQRYYRSGVGKLLHMMRWSRPDIYNSVRELSMCS